MPNELLLLLSVVLIFSGVLVFFHFFGTEGLFCWIVLATIAANIEVMILVEAFGLEQTLGNVMFASTFLVTDIISEISGKKNAVKAVNIGIVTALSFIVVSQLWLLFTPAGPDWAFPYIQGVFTNTPRIMLAGLVVYAIVQRLDVWAYHKWWQFTSQRFGDARKFLWLRNNGSTLISQAINAVLFTFFAFGGIYDLPTLLHICLASYIIFIFTSLLDTPAVYVARYLHERKLAKQKNSAA